MGQRFFIHPDNPQPRFIQQVAQKIRAGALVIFPTDSSYALGCHVGDKVAIDRIRQLRHLDKDHNFTLICRNLSELGTYARVTNANFRWLKTCTPGPYTFILSATAEVPKRLQHAKRKTIGLRVPDNRVLDALLTELGEPLMSVTLIIDDEENALPIADIDDLPDWFTSQVDVIIDGGNCGLEPTTVVNLVVDPPEVLRQGKGDSHFFVNA